MSENNNRGEVFSKSVRAGRRTYFFDVKTTRTNEYYLTITESKRMMGDDGNPIYEKHKLFVYREDFEKFLDCFTESINKVEELSDGNLPPAQSHEEPQAKKEESPVKPSSFTDVSFDDLK